MTNNELRQFALLQLEMLAQKDDSPRIWAALYAVQALDGGPVPDDFIHVKSNDYGVVEDCHLSICHILSRLIAINLREIPNEII